VFEALQYEFIQNAILAGILISVAVGIMGSLIVVNKMTFLAGGIAHSSYGGIGIAIFLGLPVLLGATLFAVAMAMVIAYLTLYNKARADSLIGIMWAFGMAIGIIFIDLTPGYNVDLMSYLFGSIIAVPRSDIVYMGILDIVIIALVVFYYQEFLTISYDVQFAKLRGIKVEFFYTLLLVLAALSVVAAIKVVGLILVIALLSIPTYLAELFCKRLSSMMVLSVLFAMGFTLLGLGVSYVYNISSGASIIIVAIVTLLIIKMIKK
jgi:zinc transport system permease protein